MDTAEPSGRFGRHRKIAPFVSDSDQRLISRAKAAQVLRSRQTRRASS